MSLWCECGKCSETTSRISSSQLAAASTSCTVRTTGTLEANSWELRCESLEKIVGFSFKNIITPHVRWHGRSFPQRIHTAISFSIAYDCFPIQSHLYLSLGGMMVDRLESVKRFEKTKCAGKTLLNASSRSNNSSQLSICFSKVFSALSFHFSLFLSDKEISLAFHRFS